MYNQQLQEVIKMRRLPRGLKNSSPSSTIVNHWKNQGDLLEMDLLFQDDLLVCETRMEQYDKEIPAVQRPLREKISQSMKKIHLQNSLKR